MLEILFINVDTGFVNYAVTDVAFVRYMTPSEIGYTYSNGRVSSASFTRKERLEIQHMAPSTKSDPRRRVVCHG